MPTRNTDRSKSRIIQMPKMHDETEPADVWFEVGMIYFQDPKNRNEVASCTLEHFREYVELLSTYVDDATMLKNFVCGRQAMRRFVQDALELIREVEPPLHVGLPIETISEIEASHAAISRRQGLDVSDSGLVFMGETSKGHYQQRASGLIVPSKNAGDATCF